MTTIDFAAILQAWETFTADDGHPALRARTGEDLTAIKVPELCPDCRNDPEWRRDGAHGDLVPCTHPNGPTIGQMLREWQALTALAEYAQHRHGCGWGRDCTCGLDSARAALEAVRHG